MVPARLNVTATRRGSSGVVIVTAVDSLSVDNACIYAPPGCGIVNISTAADRFSGTLLFSSSCDPVGANPFGSQIFAMRPDGTGLRQLTNARGMTTDSDGSIRVELAGPFAYSGRAH